MPPQGKPLRMGEEPLPQRLRHDLACPDPQHVAAGLLELRQPDDEDLQDGRGQQQPSSARQRIREQHVHIGGQRLVPKTLSTAILRGTGASSMRGVARRSTAKISRDPQ